ncbi:ribonuclease P protein component [Pullulanibacillus camelliae]|nr:ribonuclease P protein component [Pullulanibacillus camelliae]
MNKIQPLKKNQDFQHVFKKGQSTANRQFVIYVLKQREQAYARVGLSVSKKIGNAVTRNRIKRYIREGLRHYENRFSTGIDCVIIARKPTSELTYWEMLKNLKHVLKKSDLLKMDKDDSR